MQLNLAFPDLPSPPSAHPEQWQRLELAERLRVLEALARLMTKAALAEPTAEVHPDE